MKTKTLKIGDKVEILKDINNIFYTGKIAVITRLSQDKQGPNADRYFCKIEGRDIYSYLSKYDFKLIKETPKKKVIHKMYKSEDGRTISTRPFKKSPTSEKKLNKAEREFLTAIDEHLDKVKQAKSIRKSLPKKEFRKFECTASDMHPYNCNWKGLCVHCDKEVTENHNPKICALCDPEYDMSEESFRGREDEGSEFTIWEMIVLVAVGVAMMWIFSTNGSISLN